MVELWSVGETRTCVLCENEIVGTLPTFSTHITQTHNQSIIQYSAQHGNCDKQRKHRCSICKVEIDLLPGRVAEHLNTHGIAVDQYYHKHVGG